MFRLNDKNGVRKSGDNAVPLREALGFKTDTLTIKDYSDCTPEEKKVIELLRNPLSRDDLIEALNLPISQANALLSLMEIKGLIKESVGEIHLL